MKKTCFILLAVLCRLACTAQYWQQQVDYVIDVSLNSRDKTLDAFERLTYVNHSPDTLRFIWFHLWPNAYKNDRTAFSDQLLLNGNTSFYFSNASQRGYINRLDFKINGVTARTEDHPQNIDIIKVLLSQPLPPGAQAVITTPFHVQLPFNFSRGGYDGNSFQITQWYPKPAVYDSKGWHPMPYLDQGEFYSEFGSFDVRITVPEDFVVAATGVLQDSMEVKWMRIRHAAQPTEKPVRKPVHTRTAITPKVIPPTPQQVLNPVMKTLHYRQDRVHDFAWFANPDFVVQQDTCQLSNGQVIQVSSFYTPSEQTVWKNSLQFAKDALRFYSDEVGAYPYPVATVVQGPRSFGGGMEYPTITVISPADAPKDLDETIAHELGHNWFYGILATNERDHPWMDEGINSFYEYAYMDMKYGPQSQENELLFQTKAIHHTDQPIETKSEDFSENNYALVAYHKTAAWMGSLQQMLGKDSMRRLMHAYYQQWQFKHPYPEDLESIIRIYTGDGTGAHWELLHTRGILPGKELQGFAFVSPFKKGSIRNFFRAPVRNILFVSPAIGVNSYDKLMLGGVISNYKIPPNRLSFFAAPMYGTGSKKLAGLGKIDYATTGNGWIRKTDIFLNAAQFSMDEFRDTANNKLIMQVQKLVPGFRLTLREKDPKSAVRRYLQWKTFFFSEQTLHIVQDTIFNGSDTSTFLRYLLPKENRWLNQLRFVYENNRALYPFNLTVQVEQAKDFIRPAVTANYFFNYREGGLQVRLFAGKFIYTNGRSIEKQFDNDRYFLNMTGPNGYEDYTYSDYFVGRNRFDEASSQQIMIRDGAFKVRTDLLASKIGKTDDWLAAINLNTSIPKKVNPLSVLPFPIPLHVFLDIGTYAEAWDRKGEGDRFLYDAGFHIPIAGETFNIYIPIIYNKVYGDYFKSTIPKNRFLKTISFTINFYGKEVKKLNEELEF